MTPRSLKKRAAISTTTAYRTATATSLLVSLSATKMPKAAAAVAAGRTIEAEPPSERDCFITSALVLSASEPAGGQHFRSAVFIWPSGPWLLRRGVAATPAPPRSPAFRRCFLHPHMKHRGRSSESPFRLRAAEIAAPESNDR